ncbi:MAG: DNA mismatch repair endonuclease MutL [Candidatus Gracilibacteria bacterium]
MSIIKILPENLVNQIAAGEVVERPASVVKELVENSIDAGADDIVVEIKNAGRTLIRVKDNGGGMSHEDAELALQRHTTSKISDEKDLWNIRTMGFRGEALASISSVSQMTLRSKCEEDLSGVEISCYGGELKTITETGMSTGTQIDVRSLFFNTPVRQKYLKKDSTEIGHVSNVLNTIALAHPEISFRFIHNEKIIFDLAKVNDQFSRIADIFGMATAEAMLPVFFGGSNLQIDGFVGKPVISRSTNQHQYFFVNKRPVQNFLLANTVKQAFHSMLMEDRKPVFIINITIDPALIDVNVHPRKVEIRFEDQQSIIQTIYGVVKTALEKNVLIPKGFTESRRYMSDAFPKNEKIIRTEKPVENALEFSKKFFEERESGMIRANAFEEAKAIQNIFQVANSYIVHQSDDGVILIDQHAAHERVRYEQLMDQFENGEKSIQPLLVPFQMELTTQEFGIISENMDVFKGLGFEIEPFGGHTFVISALPSFLSGEDPDSVVKGVLDDVINQKNPSKVQGRMEAIINYMACRSAIKFGQRLGAEEMQSLIRQLDALKRPYTCPHGRPTMISLSLNELHKMFGRK